MKPMPLSGHFTVVASCQIAPNLQNNNKMIYFMCILKEN